MPLDPGKLDRRVTVQARTSTRDAEGSAVDAFATEATIWAQKVQTTGSEARRAGSLRAETDLVLRIRYRSTLTEQHRLVFEGRTYDIVSIVEEGRREAQVIQARFTEGAAA